MVKIGSAPLVMVKELGRLGTPSSRMVKVVRVVVRY